MKVDFTGLGVMGKLMSKNLLKVDYELVVFDFNKDAVKGVMEYGVVSVASGREVAKQCGVAITMAPNSPHVHAVVLDENGAVDGAKPETVLINMSSIDPTESKAVSAELAKKGIDMLGAPVSGGESKVIDGTLSVMVGGKKELFDKYYNMLMVMVGSAVYIGELGSGNVAKSVNQIVAAVNIAAVPEAFTFTKKVETDPELVHQATHGELAESTVMDAKVPTMLSRNFKPGFCIEPHIKDSNNMLNAVHAISSPVPLTGQSMEIMQGLRTDGYEKEDHVSIVKYYEKIANIIAES